jgi:hypothetical protein
MGPRPGLPQAGFFPLDAVIVVEQARLAGAGRAVAGIELRRRVLVLDQHGCLRGCSPGAAGAGCGLAISVWAASRSWRPVLVPTCGPAGQAVGKPLPVGLAMKLGDPRRGQRDPRRV